MFALHRGEDAFDPLRSSAMVRGLSNREIGQALFIAETTANFHVTNILRKLEVSRRSEAVYVASQFGAV